MNLRLPHGAFVVSVLLTAAPSGAQAAACGIETARSGGSVTNVRTANTTCIVGRDVAGRWYSAQARGDRATRVRDRLERAWSCRITQRATGTDPGLVARTKVRCTRGKGVVSFELRS